MPSESVIKPPPIRRRRRLLFGVVLLGMSLLGVLLVGELALRVHLARKGWTANCYAADLDLFVPHPEAGATLKRKFRLRSGVYEMSTNDLGMRGPNVAAEKPAGTIRVAMVGESSTFGYLVNDGEEAARLLEASLVQSGLAVEVVNAGVPSYNLFQERIRFRELVAPLKPDIVVCYLGWNDLGYVVSETPAADSFRRRPIASAPERLLGRSVLYTFVTRRILKGSPLPPAVLPQYKPSDAGQAQFRENLLGLIQEIRDAQATPILCAQATAARTDVDDALRPSLGTPERQPEMIALGEWLRATERTIASDAGVPFTDCSEHIPATNEFLADQVHLTRTGEQQLAKELERIVREALKSLH